MKLLISLVVTILVAALSLQASFCFGSARWYAPFPDWAAHVLEAVAGPATIFLFIVLPIFFCLTQLSRKLSLVQVFGLGALISTLAAAIWFWILGSKPPLTELVAAALADGAGLLTYVRFQPTALTRRIQSGVLMATSGAYLWALVYSLWQYHRGSSPDWRLLLLFPPGVILLSSWFLLPMGGLLGVWPPRLAMRSHAWLSFASGSILGALVAAMAVLLLMAPGVLLILGSGVSDQHMALVEGPVLRAALTYALTLVPAGALWVGLWAVKFSRRISIEP